MLSILNASKVFSELAETNFSGAVAFKIARLIREMNKEIEDFDKQRANIALTLSALKTVIKSLKSCLIQK